MPRANFDYNEWLKEEKIRKLQQQEEKLQQLKRELMIQE